MSISLYEMTVPVFRNSLNSLSGILTTAKGFCQDHNIDEAVIVNDRLFGNMFPLALQVGRTTDHARNTVARLAGAEPEAWEDNEKSFDDLLARVKRSIDYMEQFSVSQFEGSESRPVTHVVNVYQLDFPNGAVFLSRYALPNFYFHLSTAYNILRHNGVMIGKRDFLGDMGGEITLLHG